MIFPGYYLFLPKYAVNSLFEPHHSGGLDKGSDRLTLWLVFSTWHNVSCSGKGHSVKMDLTDTSSYLIRIIE